MNIVIKLMIILGLSALPACAAPPNETEAERASRIDGIALASAAVIGTILFLGVQFFEEIDEVTGD